MNPRIPEPIRNYFADDDAELTIVQLNIAGGWHRMTVPIEATWTNLRPLLDSGAHAFGISDTGDLTRVADFTAAELEREARRPLFGGRVI
jgi:hypothetical protein